MNQEDLFQAIGSVEESVLQKLEQQPSYHNWKRFAAAAACFLILISGILHLLPAKNRNGHTIYPGSVPWITDDPVERITNPPGQGVTIYTWYNRFDWQISIEAKVKEILPDIYRFTGGTRGNGYRILLLEVKDTIGGKNVPSEIYYMLPTFMCPDLDQFDTLIMTIEQYEIEDCVMINATQKRVESFRWMFCSGTYAPDWGGVLAFTNRKLDTSLWTLEGWGDRPDIYKGCLSNDSYPAKENSTLKQVKAAIRKGIREAKDSGMFNADEVEVQGKKDIFTGRKAQEALAYMKDKTFRQMWRGGGRKQDGGWYKRIINGLPTNESLLLSARDEEVKYSETRFTEADLQNLPPLADMLVKAPTMQPPEGYENEDCRYSGASGEYYKSGSEVFGILRVYWRCDTKTVERVILIRQDGTQIETTDEEVKDLIASYAS